MRTGMIYQILKRFIFGFLVLANWLPGAAQAQELSSNRWLLIVETSRPMQRRAEAARHIAANLIASGMNGQLRRGDTLGVWTFGDALHTGSFPLQHWTGDRPREIATRVLAFLGDQKHDRESFPGVLVQDLQDVVQDSELITIVLITEGSSANLGTSFDAQIKAEYTAWRAQQMEANMPFVTVLRAERGRITSHMVNTPPFPLELPDLPRVAPRPAPAPVVKTVQPETNRRPTPEPVPSLIISGKKAEAAAAPAGASLPELQPMSALVALHSNTISSVATPSLAAVPPPPAPAAAQSEAVVHAPVPVEAESPALPVSPIQAAAPASIANPILTIENASVSQGAERVEIIAEPAEASPRWVWFAIASVAALIGLAVALKLSRRAERHPTSLITRSLNREPVPQPTRSQAVLR